MNERSKIITDSTDFKRIIREYYKQIYVSTFDYLNKCQISQKTKLANLFKKK